MRTSFDRDIQGLGITAKQAEILHRCSLAGERTPKQLTRLLLTDNASVTRLVDRLEAKGLVTRRTSPIDRRSVSVRITPAGRAAVPRIARLAQARKRRMLAGLSPSDRERMRALLTRILANVGTSA
ncbi:MAG TPA: MarR family transcriptional regulator [Candidatus Limnocylindria bacterium]|jgi:DNA-binding MarR family transcriptional regulator|nr:MarR family transcriptional regulator [Candidatus Limnocylindria bacterium]